MKPKIFYPTLAGLLCSASAVAQPADPVESGRFVLAGFGDVKYEQAELADSSAFSANFVPIFLFRLNDRMHVEAEAEIGLGEDGDTEVELEYADIHYFLTDSTTLTAGKFLLPFGQFSANWHPSWINRSPWTPGIYGSHGGSQAMAPLLPVLSDVGLAVQQIFPIAGHQKIFLDLFVTNGARAEAEEHAEEAEAEHGEEPPEVAFEPGSGDNNNDKAIGGRLAYAWLPGLELGASYYRASYDADESLDFIAKGLDINLIANHFLLRGEYIRTEADGLEEEDGVMDTHTFVRDGWYVQGSVQLGQLWPALGGTELVLEWAETNKLEAATRWVAGVNYWLDARSVLKLAYEDTDLRDGDDDQRVALQFSYGF